MSYNVFTDFHHAGLLNSLILLFENRFGGNVYRPIGREWFDLGYWKVYDHPATVEQYLGIGGATPDGSPKLNEVINKNYGVYRCFDVDSGKSNKAITHNLFMKSKIDFVIATIPQHIEPFRKLCDLHSNKPKLIYQIGNTWNIRPEQESLIDFVLASSKLVNNPKVPYIEYHQEFDLDLFKPSDDYSAKTITSFVNCFSTDKLFELDWRIFQEVENRMLDWDFKAMGGQCRNGSADGAKEVAKYMRNSKFIWHTKNYGDGYGHIIHNCYACGKPPIVRLSQYSGKMAGELMLDGQTCINIDGLSIDAIVSKIHHYSEIEHYAKLCKNVYNIFKTKVNFNNEADKIIIELDKLYGKSNRRFSNRST